MRKAVFPVLIAVSMIMLVVTPVFASTNVSALGNEQGFKLPLKGFATSLQWNRGDPPDLAVYDDEITFDPISPMEGETVKITAVIRNVGDRYAFRVKVGFYDGTPSADTLIGTTNIWYVRAGSSSTTSISWTAAAGTHKIYVWADPDNTISELDEKNNIAYNTISVSKPTPDVNPPTVEIIDPTDGQVINEKTYRIRVNATDAEGKIANVWISINETWTDVTQNFDGTYYFYDWGIAEEGAYIIGANATDNSGNMGYATQITVTVEFPVVTADKWALLIGISDYEGTQNDLWNPHRDALDMYEALTTFYGFPGNHIHMLLNEGATMDAILAGIDWLNSVEDSPDDVVVFFFCGHGYQTSELNWQWRNADGDREVDRRDEFIVSYDLWAYADGYLAQKFATFDSKNIFIWFGSCYSGGMIWDITYWAKDFSGVICTACKENQYGFDVYGFENTLFGEFYVDQGLLQGKGDFYGNKDGTTTVEEAFYYAQPRVAEWAKENTGYSSEPQIFDTDPAIDFYL